jgi:hypothetical protein
MKRVAYFVTAHGMGHAARACAVMESLQKLDPEVEFEVFSRAPAWVFETSLERGYRLNPVEVDIGLVQRTPYEEDVPGTLRRLGEMLPYRDEWVGELACLLLQRDCDLVICDIAPLGIAAAKKAGLPCVLIENFRWDWIYAGYLAEAQDFVRHIDYLAELFAQVDFHIQTEPRCDRIPQAVWVAPPISRGVRTSREIIRQQVGVPQDRKMVLVTSSATPSPLAFEAWAERLPGLFFVLPDDVPELQPMRNGVRTPRRYYHPDLVNASDAVAGKAGYSTLAEAYQAGVLFAFVGRRRFRESAVLGEFIRARMGGFEIPDEWQALDWLVGLQDRLVHHSPAPQGENGAAGAARFILEQCLSGS